MLATFFTAAVDQYVAAYGEKRRQSGMRPKEREGHRFPASTTSSLPAQILDIMGKNCINMM